MPDASLSSSKAADFVCVYCQDNPCVVRLRYTPHCYVTAKSAGVESYEVDVSQKKVIVKGNFDTQECVDKLNKSGKKTQLWN